MEDEILKTQKVNPLDQWQFGPFRLSLRPNGMIALPGMKSISKGELFAWGKLKGWCVAPPGERKNEKEASGGCGNCDCSGDRRSIFNRPIDL